MASITTPSVSVVVPVAFGGAHFQTCLSHLLAASPGPEEIIVVADGETDRAWQAAERPGVRVIRLPETLGPANARNFGANNAKGDILFFIDADVAVHKDVVGIVTDAFRSDPDLAAVFGSYDDAPSASNFLSQYKNLLHHYVHQTSSEEASTFWAACGAVRKQVFEELGGFDVCYRRPSIEDIELGYRMKKAGHKIRLNKKLQVRHLKRWGAINLLKTDFFSRALPWTLIILRDGRMPDDLNLKKRSRLSVGLIFSAIGTAPIVLFYRWYALLWMALWVGLLLLNMDCYRFFFKKRGLRFSFMAVPWHFFYYFYSGTALMLGFFVHLKKRITGAACSN